MKRIGDILTRYKKAEIVKDEVTYKQVTIGTNYKGVRLRGTKPGIEIGTKNQWLVKAGQFILSRIDARNGGFGIIPEELEGAIVTNDFLAYDINEDAVEREFFNIFLQSPVFLEACIKASRGNTNRKRVDEKFFLDYAVNLPPLTEQHERIKRIKQSRSSVNTVQDEIAHQKSLLTNLKQAILQEAIQGKLTEDWRAANPVGDLSTEASAKVEPACELLKRIQAEKARLIADLPAGKAGKKLRPVRRAGGKEKPLPNLPADKAGIPFEIPEGWEWCLVAGLTSEPTKNGLSVKGSDEPPGTAALKLNALSGGALDYSKRRYIEAPEPKISPILIREGDFFVARGNGSLHLLARGGVAGPIDEQVVFPDTMIRFRFFNGLEVWINTIWPTASIRHQLEARAKTAAGIYKISQDSVSRTRIPLPPLAEQAAIVERVEALMTTCRALEIEIEQSRTHAAHLLQAVLKEAFAK